MNSLFPSYLPPSPANRNNGYPQGPAGFAGASQANVPFTGAPQVIAARALGQNGHRGNGLTRYVVNCWTVPVLYQ